MVFIAFCPVLLEHDGVHSKFVDFHTSTSAAAARNFLSKHLWGEMGKNYLSFMSYYQFWLIETMIFGRLKTIPLQERAHVCWLCQVSTRAGCWGTLKAT